MLFFKVMPFSTRLSAREVLTAKQLLGHVCHWLPSLALAEIIRNHLYCCFVHASIYPFTRYGWDLLMHSIHARVKDKRLSKMQMPDQNTTGSLNCLFCSCSHNTTPPPTEMNVNCLSDQMAGRLSGRKVSKRGYACQVLFIHLLTV